MMRKLIVILSVLFMPVSGATLAADAEAGWQEVRHADGIRVLARDGEEDILKIKAVTIVDVPVAKVKAEIDDAAGHAAWVPYLIETRALQKTSASEALLYSRFNAPWPARDRDFVYYSRVSREPSGTVTYRLHSHHSDLMPQRDDYVRAVLMEGIYRLEPLDQHRTRVEFMFHADPRGRLPLWIVNSVQRRFPFEALTELRKVLTEPRPQ